MEWAAGSVAAAVENNDGDEKVQGSKAWKRWRGKGMGGSDSAVLLGWSPWTTVDELYGEKIGTFKKTFGPHQQSAMDRGKMLEPVIRRWYENRVGFLFPEDTAEHPLNPFMRASYDGINKEFRNPDGTLGRILEIKAPNKIDHANAQDGIVPDKYLTQLNWMGMVAGIRWFDYVSYGSDGTYAVVTVQADETMQNELYARAVKFWDCVQTKTEPCPYYFIKWTRPMNDAIDLTNVADVTEEPSQIPDQEIEAIVAEAIREKDVMDAAEARFEALKGKLKQALGSEEKMVRGEAVFGWQKRKGQVDYSVIPELIGLDLEQFRKADTRAFYFKRVDSK